MQNAPQQSSGNSRAKEIFQFLWRSTTNNWGFKLLSLLIAIVLWAGLITQDPTLTREKSFSDVKISIAGSDTMKRNGFIVVSDLDEILGSAQLKVDVPQMQYDNAVASMYNVRIDLSRITEGGAQEIKVLTTNSVTYGGVSQVTPETIEIEVEEYITRYRIPMNVDVIGTVPEGYYAGTPQPDPPMVAVSGPKSLVEKIVRAEAVLELGNLPRREGTVRTSSKFFLLDEQGNPVESELLSVTSESVLLDSVVVEQTMYSTKSIALSDLGMITGEPAKGYEVKSVTFTPDVISAAGRKDNLDLLDTLYVSNSVDVSGRGASFQQQLKVRRPSELVYLSADSVTVEVEIGPIVQKKGFTEQRVNIVNVENGMRASMENKTASVIITGPQLWVQGLRSHHITLTCDASGLTAGVYDLPVQCTIQNDEGQEYTVEVGPETIQVTITEK